MLKKALSIAGSDSSAGAGIQADLKTFSALGVYGMTVVTSVTAQNTSAVLSRYDLPIEIILDQIKAIFDDIEVDIVKTGMLGNGNISEGVAKEIEEHNLPLVVDTPMYSQSGFPLLDENAVGSFIENLLPLATIATPNRIEAEKLTGLKIKSLNDAKKAAEKVVDMGPKAVVIKGGHAFSNKVAIDLLYHEGKFKKFKEQRIDTKTTHGTGCIFASAIAAEMVKGCDIIAAVTRAKKFVTKSIKFGLPIGKGFGPVNPLADLYNNSEKYSIIMGLSDALITLENCKEVMYLIPESQSNLAYSLPYAEDYQDVAGIPGRIVKLIDGVKASSCPKFGASSHVSRTVLTAKKFDRSFRSAMNIKYSEKILESCKELGLSTSFYDRKKEPHYIKVEEGMSTIWGAERAIKRCKKVPDAIFHKGDFGKEPMITILGKNPQDVANKIIKIAKTIKSKC
jgi:hydroxymethylpyrimidine/phosphomethylpyrimidine kinase